MKAEILSNPSYQTTKAGKNKNVIMLPAAHVLAVSQYTVNAVEDIAKAMNLDLVALDKPIKVNETVLIVNKDEKELANEIEAALEKLSKDGTLKQISEKWYHRNLFDQLDEANAQK